MDYPSYNQDKSLKDDSPSIEVGGFDGKWAMDMGAVDSKHLVEIIKPDYSGVDDHGHLGQIPKKMSPDSVKDYIHNVPAMATSLDHQDQVLKDEDKDEIIVGMLPAVISMGSAPAQSLPALALTIPNEAAGHFTQITAPSTSNTPMPFVRPAYVKLSVNRINPPGPEPHPDPNFRPIGANNWAEILHDIPLLQYLTTSTIAEIKSHIDSIVMAAKATQPDDFEGPILLGDGPYNTKDASVVWDYCEAYLKRRHQVRNNRAAQVSRQKKEFETRHWHNVALAAGANNIPFYYDQLDPAYNGSKIVTGMLPEVTQKAIAAMKTKWLGLGLDPDQLDLLPIVSSSSKDRSASKARPTARSRPAAKSARQRAQQALRIAAAHNAGQMDQQEYVSGVDHDQLRSYVPLPSRTRAQTRANARRPAGDSHDTMGDPGSPTDAVLGLVSRANFPLVEDMHYSQSMGSGDESMME